MAKAANSRGQVVGYYHDQWNYYVVGRVFLWSARDGMRDLGNLGANAGAQIWPTAINDLGQVAGTSRVLAGGIVPFIWTEEAGIQELATPGGSAGDVTINNLGQVTGYSTVANGEQHVFLYTIGEGIMQDLGTLGGQRAHVNAINDLGQIVGRSDTPSGENHAFIWTEKDDMVDLGTFGGSTSNATGINDLGQVVGYSQTATGELRAFLWTELGGMEDLGTLGGSHPHPRGINNQGEIVAMVKVADDFHAVLRDANGTLTTLWNAGPYPTTLMLNDLGQVAGSYRPTVYTSGARLWTRTDGVQELGGLGGILTYTEGIGNRGLVVGGSKDATGLTHAAVWQVTAGPTTPQEAIEIIVAEIQSLVDSGTLSAGRAEALLSTLDTALVLATDRPNAACNLLGAFANQVQAQVNAGFLSPAEGEALIDQANEATELLCG